MFKDPRNRVPSLGVQYFRSEKQAEHTGKGRQQCGGVAIRPIAVGRRNSLFIGAPEAGERAAILYTLLRECQRVKVDSVARLTEVLDILPDYQGDYIELLPGILRLPRSERVKEKPL